jgi:cysteine synthase A
MDGDVDHTLLLHRLRVKLHETACETGAKSAFGPPRVASNVTECIHETPLVEICPASDTSAQVVAKLEYLSPGGSIKDRIALHMVEDAERRGIIRPGRTTVVDLTSGNTGIGLGVVCASKGYSCIQIMPEPMSLERRALMLAMGVDLIITPKESGIAGALKKYFEVLHSLGEAGWSPRQFDNPVNIAAHVAHTGPEIWEQCDGRIDAIVAAYGTGGTISGVTQFLRGKNPNFLAITVEPMEGSNLNGDAPAPHGIQGISPPFICDNVKTELLDQVVRVNTEQALDTSRSLARTHGILCGISAGANVCAALQVASRPEMAGKRIVTVLPSAAERYLSTPLYAGLMEDAKSLELCVIDDSIEISGIGMNTRQTLNEAGKIRSGFKVF